MEGFRERNIKWPVIRTRLRVNSLYYQIPFGATEFRATTTRYREPAENPKILRLFGSNHSIANGFTQFGSVVHIRPNIHRARGLTRQ